MTRAIGIDLGTTYTVVATIQEGRPVVIPNREGQHLTPSVVAFTRQGDPLVGQAAKAQGAANPEATVFSIKRRMGSDYRVMVDGRDYTPQEVSSLILRKVKADAEAYLGEPIVQAVITVPAYFNDRQRQATREAGVLAGLEIPRIINEPTATALAYGLHREEVHTVLVWDLGGGTFDISILDLGEGIFEVRAVSGDTWLGGDDIDAQLTDYLAGEYRKASGRDFPADPGARQRLREVAEGAKIQLSSRMACRVALPGVGPPAEVSVAVELTREQLETLAAGLLQRMAAPARQALRDARLAPEEVDRLILAGGATRMPAVRRLARTLLGKEPYRYVDPDQVVALGAAVQAGMLLGLVDKVVLLDVLPLSVGVETLGGLMATLIPRNTPLPASGSQIFTTAADYQTAMDIHVLQGERALAVDNVSLGQFQLRGIPLARRGVPKVEVALEADVDGMVQVSARELMGDTQVEVKVAAGKLLDPQEIGELAEDARRSSQQDRETRQWIGTGIEAESLANAAEAALLELAGAQPDILPAQQVRQALSRLKDAQARGDTEELRAAIQELRRLLAACPGARHAPGAKACRGAGLPARA